MSRLRAVDLPPYSPDLNPIDLAFGKLKPMLDRITAGDAAGNFGHGGDTHT